MRVLITGANRGIGLALADAYRKGGEEVVATSRSGDTGYPLDVTDPASQRGLATQLAGDPIDLLICNAGVFLDKGTALAEYTADMWADGLAANVTGVFLTIQSLLPNVQAAGGKIAIISSQMASSELAPGGAYLYRASKAAALNLGRNLAVDLKSQGVSVGIYTKGASK